MSDAPCPRCASPLVTYTMAPGILRACARCGGHWLDNAAAQRLLANDVPEAAHELLRPVERSPAPVTTYRDGSAGPSGPPPVPCAYCGATCTAYVTDASKVGASVHLDVCAAHGVWFDRGAAWALLQAVAVGRTAIAHVEAARRNAVRRTRDALWEDFVDVILGPRRYLS